MNEGQLPTNQLLDSAYICAWIRTNISMRIRDKGITYIERERERRERERESEREKLSVQLWSNVPIIRPE